MPAVLSSAVGRVKPGRFEDFVSQSLEVKKLYERLGARHPRLMTAGSAGEAFGTWTFSAEFPDWRTYGAFADALNADHEMQSLIMRLQQPDNPTIIEQVHLAAEVPLPYQPRTTRGPVSVVNVSKPNPGGLTKSHELAARASKFAEDHGALSARVFDLIAAGTGTGMMLSIWEFENMQAFCTSLDAWATEPEGKAIALEADGGALTRIFDATYAEVPL